MASLDARWAGGVAVIGAGAVASALGRRLVARGYAVRAVLSRRAGPARALAARLSAPVASARLRDLPPEARLVLCCVPDDALPEVAEGLAALPHEWPACIALHTSGVRPAAALAPLSERGAAVLSFHPVQTITAETPPEALNGIYIGLEGDEEAVAAGQRMAADLGAHALVLSAEAKPRYHLAAVLASNAMVTVAALALETLASTGVERGTAAAVLGPLLRSTGENLAAGLPEEVLTGPIARGDVGTVREHTAAVRAHLPHLAPVYAALAAETVRVAVHGGGLDAETADAILEALQDVLDL